MPVKRPRLGEKQEESSPMPSSLPQAVPDKGKAVLQIETGFFSRIPPELFRHIFKFLSSEVCFIFFFLLTLFVPPPVRERKHYSFFALFKKYLNN